ncbi:MAG: lipoyl synthase [Phycisphaerales bacterium]|nr:lipoyl synthase [Phycisphaerales bacterium]
MAGVNLSSMILAADPPASPQRKPSWIRARLPGGAKYHDLRRLIEDHNLHTVCEEARCPNMGECWADGVATIMILGDVCTRSCGFCHVKTGRPPTLDLDEPARVAETIRIMDLRHVVITSVNRDELPDGGASVWADTILRTHAACPDTAVEVLIPDFCGKWGALQVIIDASPEVLGHNMETVRRLYRVVRPQAKYDRSIELLRRSKEAGLVTKTGIMAGIGETDDEVLELMDDVIAGSGCDILTVGQYLQPTRNHLPVERWVDPERFEFFREEGLRRGFKVVESGPMVRSSYHADKQASQIVKPGTRRLNLDAARP